MLIDMNLSQSRERLLRLRAPMWPEIHALENRFRVHRFLFSEETSAAVGQDILDHPDRVRHIFDDARPPFPICYIEFPCHVYGDVVNGIRGDVPLRDKWIGHVMANGVITSLVSTSLNRDPTIVLPWAWTLWNHTPPPNARPLFDYSKSIDEIDDESFWNHIVMIFGKRAIEYLRAQTKETSQHPMVEALVRRAWNEVHGYTCAPPALDAVLGVEKIISDGNAIGEIRALMAHLAWLNRYRERVIIDEVPARHEWVKGKSRAFPRHHVVRIAPQIKVYATTAAQVAASPTPRQPPGYHEVRGFYRHSHIDRHCDHVWVPLDPLPSTGAVVRYRCAGCHGRRTWVSEHHRGVRAASPTPKEYQV